MLYSWLSCALIVPIRGVLGAVETARWGRGFKVVVAGMRVATALWLRTMRRLNGEREMSAGDGSASQVCRAG
jgi:hypothetical protein